MNAKELIAELQRWALEAATKRSIRPWCLLGFTSSFNHKNIANLFGRNEIGQEYKARYQETVPSKKKPHSFFQIEAHLLYGAHKAFVARHKTRMQYYRDDSAQKAYHTRRAVDKAFSRLSVLQSKAEGEPIDV